MPGSGLGTEEQTRTEPRTCPERNSCYWGEDRPAGRDGYVKDHRNTQEKKGPCLWAIKGSLTEEVALSRALKGK